MLVIMEGTCTLNFRRLPRGRIGLPEREAKKPEIFDVILVLTVDHYCNYTNYQQLGLCTNPIEELHCIKYLYFLCSIH